MTKSSTVYELIPKEIDQIVRLIKLVASYSVLDESVSHTVRGRASTLLEKAAVRLLKASGGKCLDMTAARRDVQKCVAWRLDQDFDFDGTRAIPGA